EQTEFVEPDTVLAVRKVCQQGEEVKQVLVQWKGKTAEEATWEDVIMIKSQFPKFNIEDNVVEEEGIDRDQMNLPQLNDELVNHTSSGPKEWKVYSRRAKK
ncbi:mediator of RNA polymerase II transcription subunit 15A-like, partial [Trifolium medium]|nr:mediator of RNA polymerase II transcription subunit 15A-like [Trifolium medium]